MTSTGWSRFCPRLARLAGLILGALLLAPSGAHAQAASQNIQSPHKGGSLQRALESASKREHELQGFYRERRWRPLWLESASLSPAADTLMTLAERVDADGLDSKALKIDEVAALLRRAEGEPSPKNLARAELALSRMLAAYIRGTRVQRETGMSYQSSLLVPAVPSVSAALESAAAAPSLAAYIENHGWMHPFYSELRRVLAGNTLDPGQERLVRLNLERARALPVDPGPRYVLIDAAAARLWMYENGKPVDSMKVVVGKPDQATPMMAGMLTEAMLNPYWNVPVDLAQSNIAVAVLRQGLSYLRNGGYQVLSDFSADATLLDPATIDWKAVAAGTRELRVRQLPGRNNFMGKVKFNFPNPDGIYLHDTPEKHLLKNEVRTASAGCVRLEDAARFGKWLFGKPLVPQSREPELAVRLEQPVPVYITYLTAVASDGKIVFRDDVYQRDEQQWAVLGEAASTAAQF